MDTYKTNTMKIIKYQSKHQQAFESLNRAWVEKYFVLEEKDRDVLGNPDAYIIEKGGTILLIEEQERIIGTVALIFVEEGIYELAKMTVEEGGRGRGVGRLLCQAAINQAHILGAKKLILFTNVQLKHAIDIYKKLGFVEVELEGELYARANVKMELELQNNRLIKWFDRKFQFSFGQEYFPLLLERLAMFPMKLQESVYELSVEKQTFKPDNKWSIKEHIGHLWILEMLWQNRFLEIKTNKEQMSLADLNNIATDQAQFNQVSLTRLISDFAHERRKTIILLQGCTEQELQYSLVHPRLKQAMRIIDLMYFVAEHDTHHANDILKIKQS